MNDFDNWISNITADDADLCEMNAQPTKGPAKKFAQKPAIPAGIVVRGAATVSASVRKQNAVDAFDEAEPGLREFLAGATWSDFAQSLSQQLTQRGSLSPKQIAAARSMMAKVVARAATPQVDLSSIKALFDAAAAKGHKRPTYRAHGLLISRAPDTGRNAGALYVKADGEYQGKLLGANWSPVREALASTTANLQAIAANPVGEAVKYGAQTGCCSFCARELTDARSVQVGYGPVCAENFGLPWGEV